MQTGSIELINNSDSAEKKGKARNWTRDGSHIAAKELAHGKITKKKLVPNKGRITQAPSPSFRWVFCHLHLQNSCFSTFSCFHRQIFPHGHLSISRKAGKRHRVFLTHPSQVCFPLGSIPQDRGKGFGWDCRS